MGRVEEDRATIDSEGTQTPNSGQDTSVEGTWVNELGSRMTLRYEPSGLLHGRYASGVGELAGKEYDLIGYCDSAPQSDVVALGFVVRWIEDHSVTTWSGHFEPAQARITATWLLAARSMGDDLHGWRSLLTGQDTFRRPEDSAHSVAASNPRPSAP